MDYLIVFALIGIHVQHEYQNRFFLSIKWLTRAVTHKIPTFSVNQFNIKWENVLITCKGDNECTKLFDEDLIWQHAS